MSTRFQVIATAVGILAIAACAQAQGFEVASVKPNRSGSLSSNYPRLHNGSFRAMNASLKTLIAAAYGISPVRIIGEGWLDAERFDILAKAPEGVPDTDLKPMLQGLLKDRFQLAAHSETREMAAYDMTAAKGGIKLHPFDPEHPPVAPPNTGGSLLIGAATMPQIAENLARVAGRPITDLTGIEGRFGYAVYFAPLSAQGSGNAAGADLPDFFAAVQQQLGLKLESRKRPFEVLVVDHAERSPTEN